MWFQKKSKSISWKKHVWLKTLKSTKHKDSIKISIEDEKQRFQNLQESIFLKKSFFKSVNLKSVLFWKSFQRVSWLNCNFFHPSIHAIHINANSKVFCSWVFSNAAVWVQECRARAEMHWHWIMHCKLLADRVQLKPFDLVVNFSCWILTILYHQTHINWSLCSVSGCDAPGHGCSLSLLLSS